VNVAQGAVPARALRQEFPGIALKVKPPFAPMEAKSVKEIPSGTGWQYEPKWDGFRCLCFRKGGKVLLQSKSGQPLGRYFPEIVAALAELRPEQFVLDGEIVIEEDGVLRFDELLQRIHPAGSRIRRLSQEWPATLKIFDLLVDANGESLIALSLRERRSRLETFFEALGESRTVQLSPMTTSHEKAVRWMQELARIGCDGMVAKELDAEYRSGERSAMVKIKRLRTADCVVGGFRYASKGGEIGSLLLGLYNGHGLLDHVGFSASFKKEERAKLKKILEPKIQAPGFTGAAPGGPSRWSTERSTQWQPLRPELVCEVQYDHFSGGRFRHGTKFLRWRPDKAPRQCTFEQVVGARSKLKKSA
jgi:ATP-dependent DNA ligase